MTLDHVKAILVEEKVPQWAYSIGGLGSGECVGINHDGSGWWEVYFSERGEKRNIRSFADEDEACALFLSELESLLAEYGKPIKLLTRN
jgi:hypothetical protein